MPKAATHSWLLAASWTLAHTGKEGACSSFAPLLFTSEDFTTISFWFVLTYFPLYLNKISLTCPFTCLVVEVLLCGLLL